MLVRSASQPAHLRLELGVRLGAYEIVNPLGAGGMGEVYRACDARLGREWRSRCCPTESRPIPARWRCSSAKRARSRALSHPNILSIHDRGQSEAIVSAAMERLHGTTLRERFTLFLKPSNGAGNQEENPTPLTLILNWTTELKR